MQVIQLCMTLDALLEGEIGGAEALECFFLEALYCSLGATLLECSREKFDEFIKGLSALTIVNDEKKLAGLGEIPGKCSLVICQIANHSKKYYFDFGMSMSYTLFRVPQVSV